MTSFHASIAASIAGLLFFTVCGIVACALGRVHKGRVSKRIARSIGFGWMQITKSSIVFWPLVLLPVHRDFWALAACDVLLGLWYLDDVLTGGDKPKEKRKKLGVTIRMPSLRPLDYGIAAGH